MSESTFKPPTIGERFYAGWDHIGTRIFSTSIVQEVIDDNTFRTYNSIYEWEILPQKNFDELWQKR